MYIAETCSSAAVRGLQAQHQLWQAALRGDTTAVRRSLRQGHVPPNARHHVSGSRLMLRLAAVRARTAAHDRRMRDVMLLLTAAGWCPEVRQPLTGTNALHLLAWQPPGRHVDARVAFLVRHQLRQPKLKNMLSARGWLWLLPEDAAAVLQPARARYLRRKRIVIAARTKPNGGLIGRGILLARMAAKLLLYSQVGQLCPL